MELLPGQSPRGTEPSAVTLPAVVASLLVQWFLGWQPHAGTQRQIAGAGPGPHAGGGRPPSGDKAPSRAPLTAFCGSPHTGPMTPAHGRASQGRKDPNIPPVLHPLGHAGEEAGRARVNSVSAPAGGTGVGLHGAVAVSESAARCADAETRGRPPGPDTKHKKFPGTETVPSAR